MTTVYVCSNKNCRATHPVDPHGHCPKCKRDDGSGWLCVTTDVPRRSRLDLASAGESAIRAAVDAVEGMGASPLLTDAVILLGEARERVADHVDGVPRRAPDGDHEDRVKLPLSTFKPTTTLGALIAALQMCPADADVQFDFCYLRPTTLASYRGDYSDLALGWTEKSVGPDYWPKVAAVIAELNSAIGKTFEGWKGGDFTMSEKTPIWVANTGEGGGTAIVAIQNDTHTVTLITDKAD